MKNRSILLLSVVVVVLVFLILSHVRIHSGYDPVPRSGRSGAMEALDFWSASRAYPEADIPADKYYRAYADARMRFKDVSHTLSSSSVWEPMGPLNLQGRSKSVAINPLNPNTVYLGTASGGLWRTRTGVGGDWQQIRLGYPALGISAIAVDPTDSNRILVGTGEVYRYGIALGGLVIRTTRGSYGIGILRTTDGGTTWSKSLDWTYQQQRGVQRLAINPLNSRTVFAATTEGILKSTDGGDSWSSVLPVIMGQDLVIHASDTNRILASCGNFASPGYGVYRSTDAGSNWALLGGLPAFSGKTMLGAYRSDNNVVYASVADSTTGVGSLWKTTNFGTNWTFCSNNTTNSIFGVQGWYSHFAAVHPSNSSIVVHNSVGLSKSVDGGLSFGGSAGGYADNHSFAIHPTDPNILYIVNDDGIYRSTNFGDSYQNIGFGLQTGQFYAGFSSSTTDSTIALVQSQDHIPGYRYLGSMVWDDQSAVDEAGWTAIDPVNDANMFAVTRFGQSFYRSGDRGSSFSFVVNFGSTGAWNTPLVVAPSNPSILYVAKQRVFRSSNGGATWVGTNGNVNVSTNPALAMAISSNSPDTVYVGMAPLFLATQFFRTTNSGTSWTNITGTLPNRYPLDLAVDHGDARIVYATFGGFGGGHVFKSTDAGGTWTDISGTLPDVPTGAVAVDPFNTNIIYAGNDIGVFVTTDAGTTWLGFSEGLPDAVITTDLTVSPSNGSLRIGTHGNGAYERRLFDGSSPPAFDYRPVAFVIPSSGVEILAGTTLTSFSVSVRNSGAQAQTDSFDVVYRISKGGVELFSSTRREPGLGLSEIRNVSFTGSVPFPDTGTIALEAIVAVTDANAANDTLRGTLAIIDPSITRTVAVRTFRPYNEIAGGTPGPAGDDVQSRILLPFAFTFDGISYDSLQISTNGWVEFGTGSAGSVTGLATPDQLGGIGANENGRLGWAARPTKAIGAWWEDLNTDPPGSSVTYTTLLSAPDRIFVVQWKNIRAYYDAGVTTYLNFQVRLYEATGRIELSYGPITAGSFFGADAGAMIGLKDIVGGSYHYFDLATGRTGTETEVTTDLNPLTDWPGPDTSIVIGSTTGIAVDILNRWNLVSVPVLRQDYSVPSIYPQLLAGTLNEFTPTGYEVKDSILPGIGYWGKSSIPATQVVVGDPMGTITIPVRAGWNLIGSVDHEVSVPVAPPVVSAVYGFDEGYRLATTLRPGKGYWVKASADGFIQLGGPMKAGVRTAVPPDAMEILLTDGTGNTSLLYIAERNSGNADPSQFELPPAPPAGIFDARFASQRILEYVDLADPRNMLFAIEVSSVRNPLIVRAKNTPPGCTLMILAYSEGTEVERFSLSSGTDVMLSGAEGRHYTISVERSVDIPRSFALEQNYPNPFNPSTVIRYSLPVESHVTLKVYNRLGQLVATPVNGIEPAGYRSVKWNAEGVASGVYFYRLEISLPGGAGDLPTLVRKMILIR